MRLQYGERFFSYSPGNSLCCKIENVFSQSCTNCSHCRKDRGHGLSYSCRCLDKNLSFCGYRVIYTGYDFSLSLTIFKRELQITHGHIPFFFPCNLVCDPFMISVQKFLVPQSEFFQRIFLSEKLKLLCVQIPICHLHSDLLRFLLLCVDPGITHCLCTVNLHRLLQLTDICINTLDLIDPTLSIFCEDSVSSALYLDTYIFIFCFIFKRNLRSVMASHPALYFSVQSAALLHCFSVRRSSPVVKIPAS